MKTVATPTTPAPTMPRINRRELEAYLCRQSFFDYFLRFWPEIVPEKLVLNWHIEVLCNELQQLADRVIRREPKAYDLVVNVSPGSTKSTIATVMFPVWLWVRDATLRTICGSYGYDLSLDLSTVSQRLVNSDKHRALFPDVKLVEDTKRLITTSKGGQRIATSTEGSITGKHAHIIIIDDPLDPKKAVSDVTLKAANDWFDHTLISRCVSKEITPLVLIMQRLHQNDPTGHRLAKADASPVRHICLPARMTDKVRPRNLRKKYVNGLFDPVRLSDKVLTTAEAEMGQWAYSGQYMQNPVPLGGGMFRTDRIEVCDVAPRMAVVVRYWDKAGSRKSGAFTVGVKMGIDADRRYWVLDVVRGQWEAAEREKIIRQTTVADGKGVLVAVEQEPGSGGKESAQNTIKNLAGYRVRVDRPTGDKELRADTFATQVNAGNVSLLQGPWNGVYLNELQFFPASTYKDQVDASSGAFGTITGRRWRVGGLGRLVVTTDGSK